MARARLLPLLMMSLLVGLGSTAGAAPPKAWPYVAWDRAEAIVYNQMPYGPDIPLRAWDAEHGFSPNIKSRAPVTQAQAEAAVKNVAATGGEIEVSKCAFPRHAIVFYAGETPVASVNVCFSCGDILVWPPVTPAMSSRRQLAAYDKVFAKWKLFFGKELGFDLSWFGP